MALGITTVVLLLALGFGIQGARFLYYGIKAYKYMIQEYEARRPASLRQPGQVPPPGFRGAFHNDTSPY
jgi:hypothetical protein